MILVSAKRLIRYEEIKDSLCYDLVAPRVDKTHITLLFCRCSI